MDGRRRGAAREPGLDQRLRVVDDQGASRERPRRLGGRELRRARVGMERDEPVHARLGRTRLARPVEGERRPRGGAREPRLDRRAVAERGHGLVAHGRDRRGQVPEEAVELELHPQGAEPRPVGLDAAERLEVEGERHLAVQRRELAREERVLASRRERLAELARDEGEVLVEAVHRPELGDQLHGGLLADAAHALDVVDRVAHQCQDVGDLRGLDAPALAHLGLVVEQRLARPARDGEHADAGADELEQVLVPADDDDLPLGQRQGAGDERRQGVVGLEARDLDTRDPQSLDEAPHVGELAREVVGHRRARRLVLGREGVAKRRARRVPGDREIVGLLLADELPEHRAEDQHGLRRDPLGGREVADRVVGAEELRVAVDDEEALHARCSLYAARTASVRSR